MRQRKIAGFLVIAVMITVQLLSMLFIARALAETSTAVSISPATKTVNTGGSFTVDVMVAPVVAVAGVQFNLSYDPSVLAVISVAEGSFLKQGGAGTFFMQGTIDNTTGSLTNVAGAITTPGSEVTGQGTFATVTFQAKAAGTSALTLSKVVASTKEGMAVPVQVTGGSVTVQDGTTTITVPVTGLTLDKTSDTITVGASDTLTATIVPDNATNKSVNWSSSNKSVATIDSTGKAIAVAPGTAIITVTTADGGFSDTCLVTVQAANIGSSGGGTSSPTAVTSTTGSATVNPAAGGSVSLGSNAKVTIPDGALQGSTAVDVSVQKLSNPPGAPSGFQLLGSVYAFTVGGKGSYGFARPITLTFSFDPKTIAAGTTPAIYYYDTASSQWVSLGGTVSGSTISVTVDHFTSFAVMAKQVAAAPAAPATPGAFTDVPASFWASAIIDNLNGKGYINGYPDGSFKPDSQITRVEFAVMLVKALGLRTATEDRVQFQDVPATSWCYASVATAVKAGMVKGMGDGVFAPNTPITREQMAVMIVKSLESTGYATSDDTQSLDKFGDRNSIDAWALPSMARAINAGVVHGMATATIAPLEKATRAQAAAMVQALLKLTGKL